MTFTSAHLQQRLAQYPSPRRYWVAYSGGCDSHVLLHALASLKTVLNTELAAIHINHGLSPDADEWELHCARCCEELGVHYQSIKVNTRIEAYQKCSPEEAARRARYAAWQDLLVPGEVILLAHHQDDQAETVLLQLLRGAGVKGLSAMPEQQDFAAGQLVRPLLDVKRAELLAYAEQHGLNWITDPSNFDTDFDRNFLRQDMIPQLQQRWPALTKTLSRTASHQAEASLLLEELAQQDWAKISTGDCIEINELQKLSIARQRNVLRYWLSNICKASLPDTVHLQRILDEVLTASQDARPQVSWEGGDVRRFQGKLFGAPSFMPRQVARENIWTNFEQPFDFNHDDSCLQAKSQQGLGIKASALKGAKVEIRFRQGGESCRPAGRGHTHQLKKLMQEWMVPPWQRDNIPLVFVDGELAQVVGYCLCEPFNAESGESSWLIEEKK